MIMKLKGQGSAHLDYVTIKKINKEMPYINNCLIIFIYSYFKVRKRLLSGRVPDNNFFLSGRDPDNNLLLSGTPLKCP